MSPAPHQDDPDPTPAKRSLGRRLLRWGLRATLALTLLLVALLAAGFVWEQIASRGFADRYPAPGRTVTLGDGRALHFVVKGAGEPTLVLESGAGGPHTDWDAVIDALAETTRVIAYDRAGYGWSDPSSQTNSAAIITDLHEGLGELGVSGPVVLVGHSVGGVYVRHYASVYPQNVVGLVLVDSSHEEQRERLPAPVTELMESMQTMMGVLAFGSRFGVLRALTAMDANPLVGGGLSAERSAMAIRSATLRAQVREMASFGTSMAQARAAAAPLGALPLLVLSATEPPQGLPPELEPYVDEAQAVFAELQLELAALSSNARHVRVPGAGHYVHVERPDVVIGELRAMIEALRADEPLPPVEDVAIHEQADPGARPARPGDG